MNTIGKRIKYLRRDILNIRQSQLANILDISRTYMNMLENDINKPSEKLTNIIVEKYNINYEWLISGIGTMYTNSDSDIIDELVEEFNLTEFDTKVIENYLLLSPNERNDIHDMVKKLLKYTDLGGE